MKVLKSLTCLFTPTIGVLSPIVIGDSLSWTPDKIIDLNFDLTSAFSFTPKFTISQNCSVSNAWYQCGNQSGVSSSYNGLYNYTIYSTYCYGSTWEPINFYQPSIKITVHSPISKIKNLIKTKSASLKDFEYEVTSGSQLLANTNIKNYSLSVQSGSSYISKSSAWSADSSTPKIKNTTTFGFKYYDYVTYHDGNDSGRCQLWNSTKNFLTLNQEYSFDFSNFIIKPVINDNKLYLTLTPNNNYDFFNYSLYGDWLSDLITLYFAEDSCWCGTISVSFKPSSCFNIQISNKTYPSGKYSYPSTIYKTYNNYIPNPESGGSNQHHFSGSISSTFKIDYGWGHSLPSSINFKSQTINIVNPLIE